jgi:hypothetical protein
MKNTKEFDFERSRPVTAREVEASRKAIEAKLKTKRAPRGRPPKGPEDKYCPVSLRLHPMALRWARKEALKRKVGYQTVINDVLLRKVKVS